MFNGKVIIVGEKKTRALSLARGDKLWELDTGLPSGQGAAGTPNANGDIVYYLPVREAVNTREPEICAINLDKGFVQAHTRSRKREVPGNLLFYEGTVLSQTHTEVVAYPQLELKLAEMDRLVKANPDDPAALTDRGDYLLDKGDLGGAIADFRRALRNQPADATRAKARAKLYEAFTEYFQRDFPRAEEFLKEYEEICRVETAGKTGAELTAAEQEARRRRANFLCLVGKGREAQNRLVEAFDRYLELASEARKDELIQVVDEPSVKAAPDVWAQGRIAAMIAGAADARQKGQIEQRIAERWDRLQASRTTPLDDLRQFVALFGSLFDVGKSARLALAERLMEDTDINSLLEAEQQLCLLRSDQEKPEIAARAVEALARLNTRKGLLEDAAYYYRLLGEKYPRVTVNGKTGAEYLEDLATDKRFLPYLDQGGRYTIKGKVELQQTEDRSAHAAVLQYHFGQAGEPLPFFSRHKLSLQQDWNHQLRIVDVTTNEEKARLGLTRTQFAQIVQANNQGHRVRFNFQNLGHLVVLQLGHMVFGIDPLNKGRVLWEKNLSSLPGSTTAAPYYQSLTLDPRDGSVVLLYSDGWMQRLGEVGPLQGGVICLQMRNALVAVDPVSGRTLWQRADINSRSHVFGDDGHIYVVTLGEDGSAAGTRVYRAYDGVSVRAPDFSRIFNSRIRVQGRTILAQQTDATKNSLTLRLYDVFEGKDVWTQSYPQGSTLLTSEDPRLAGVVEPDGAVKVVDIVARKEVLNARLSSARDVEKAQAVYLLSDPDYFFLAVNGPADPNVPPWGGGLQPNVQNGSGLRSIPVNGMVYAFNRKTGGLQWYNPVENQMMIVSQFEDLPLVLFTSRFQYLSPPPARIAMWKYTARAIAKHNGKLWYDNPNVFAGMFFHSLTMDHRTGKVELTGTNLKVTLAAVPK